MPQRHALHASPVVRVEMAVLMYWTALLNRRRAKGHDRAHGHVMAHPLILQASSPTEGTWSLGQ